MAFAGKGGSAQGCIAGDAGDGTGDFRHDDGRGKHPHAGSDAMIEESLGIRKLRLPFDLLRHEDAGIDDQFHRRISLTTWLAARLVLAAEQPSPPSAGKGAIEIACRLREPYAAAAG